MFPRRVPSVGDAELDDEDFDDQALGFDRGKLSPEMCVVAPYTASIGLAPLDVCSGLARVRRCLPGLLETSRPVRGAACSFRNRKTSKFTEMKKDRIQNPEK
ncbi:hypothetical protein [Bradyrhizobium elkanii]|uniref:hypothetical protein n=1 Tax=Bradyrhizobium elkanii TaxID=29448 RepID=UPI0020A114DF|nr:hypothetical protein [Bradyrhizobium elkanii]MCP1926428.1 hypothetical protein [Bradyrhizobium elkanii]